MAAIRRAWERCDMPGNHPGKRAGFSWISSPAPALREQQLHPEGRGPGCSSTRTRVQGHGGDP